MRPVKLYSLRTYMIGRLAFYAALLSCLILALLAVASFSRSIEYMLPRLVRHPDGRESGYLLVCENGLLGVSWYSAGPINPRIDADRPRLRVHPAPSLSNDCIFYLIPRFGQVPPLGGSVPARWFPIIPLWLPTTGFGLTAFGLRYFVRRRHQGSCFHCGYQLFGNQSRTCPECGTTIPTEQLKSIGPRSGS